MSDSFERYARCRGLVWERPPEEVRRRARRFPEVSPVPPPSKWTSESRVAPEDVRSAQLGEAGSGMISHTLDRLKVTFLLRPPVGDGVWTLQGRAWFEAAPAEQVRVVLVQRENVIDDVMIRPGGSFRFQDVLLREWALEFHFENGEVAILRHETD